MADADYSLKLNADQAKVVQAALELYSRVGMGQLGYVLEHPEIHKRLAGSPREVAEQTLETAKQAIFGMVHGQYHGIHSRELEDETASAWDLQQVIRHRLAWDQAGNPDHRDFRTMGGVRFDEPRRASTQPLARMNALDHPDFTDETGGPYPAGAPR